MPPAPRHRAITDDTPTSDGIRLEQLVGGQRVLDLADHVLRSLSVSPLRVAGLGRALAALVGDELLGVRRGQDALVIGQRLQRLDPERLAVQQAGTGGPEALT